MLNGFTGKIYLNGRKATLDDAEQLAKYMPVPPGSRIVLSVLGALALAAAGPRQAIITGQDQLILTGAGSIYNREELLRQLNKGNYKGSEDANDLELMWQAFRKWGSEAPLYLDGDWMFAAYDQSREELLLARSWGISALYYYRGADFIAFATHPGVLAGLPDVPRQPNLNTLTQIMCSLPLSPNKTCYQGIYQLQPAEKMEIVRGKSSESIWWRPSGIPIRPVTDEKEMLDRFLELFLSAVRKRLDPDLKAGATLSSGLDSSSICLLAAQSLLPLGKTLQAWTSCFSFSDIF